MHTFHIAPRWWWQSVATEEIFTQNMKRSQLLAALYVQYTHTHTYKACHIYL